MVMIGNRDKYFLHKGKNLSVGLIFVQNSFVRRGEKTILLRVA